MINELFVSFKDNLKSKTTNPFFGTLIIVWILHNWRLIYAMFNFEATLTLENRLNFLAKYLDSKVFIPDLFICIGITIGVLILTYLLLNLSRLIVNFFEKTVSPQVYRLTDKSSIVLKRDFELLREERDRFEKRFEQERDSRLKLQDEYERLEVRLQNTLTNKPSNNEPTIQTKDEKFDKLKEMLNNKETLSAFREIIDVVINKRKVPDSKTTDLMLRLNLVEKGNADYNDQYNYTLTNDGKKLREMLIDFDIPQKKITMPNMRS